MRRLLAIFFLTIFTLLILPTDIYLWLLKRPIEKQLIEVFDVHSAKWEQQSLVIELPKDRFGVFSAEKVVIRPSISPLFFRVDMDIQVDSPNLSLNPKTPDFVKSLRSLFQANKWLLSMISVHTVVAVNDGKCGDYSFWLRGEVSKRHSDGIGYLEKENESIQLAFRAGSKNRFEVRSIHKNSSLSSLHTLGSALQPFLQKLKVEGNYSGFFQLNSENAYAVNGKLNDFRATFHTHDLKMFLPEVDVNFPGVSQATLGGSLQLQDKSFEIKDPISLIVNGHTLALRTHGGGLIDCEIKDKTICLSWENITALLANLIPESSATFIQGSLTGHGEIAQNQFDIKHLIARDLEMSLGTDKKHLYVPKASGTFCFHSPSELDGEVCLFGADLFSHHQKPILRRFQIELRLKKAHLQELYARGVYKGSKIAFNRIVNEGGGKIKLSIHDFKVENKAMDIESYLDQKGDEEDLNVHIQEFNLENFSKRVWSFQVRPKGSILGLFPPSLHEFISDREIACHGVTLNGACGPYHFQTENVKKVASGYLAEKIDLNSPIGHLHIPKMHFDMNGNFSILKVMGKDLKPKVSWLPKSLVLHDFQMEDLTGSFKNLDLLKGKGELTFSNRSKKAIATPLFSLPKGCKVDPLLLNPVRGTLEFTLDKGEVQLTKLKNVYSEGKMSKLCLNERLRSTIGLDGTLGLQLQIKPYNVLYRFSDLFSISINGTWEQPLVHIEKRE
ncbi:MAG: hypothetical protein WD595_04065 [Waddliaceae bacterium]